MSDYFPVYWFWATVCASRRDNRYNCALPTREDHLNNVIEWSRDNLIKFNYKKTKEMLLGAVNVNEIVTDFPGID